MKKIGIRSLFSVLKKVSYLFELYYLMCDFSKGQILDAKNRYPNSLLNCCFFQFSQIIWKKFNKYKMTVKGA